jgi:hypothetical protein
MLQEICYKALYNSITRSSFDKSVNKRLIEKSQRLESIVEAMKERGESEEYIEEVRFCTFFSQCMNEMIDCLFFSDFRNIDTTGKGNFTKNQIKSEEFV